MEPAATSAFAECTDATRTGAECSASAPPDASATALPESDLPAVTLTDATLIADIRAAEQDMRAAMARQLTLIAEAAHRQLDTQHGARSIRVWLRELLNLSDHDAHSRVLVATAIEQHPTLLGIPTRPALPATAEAIHTGAISVHHARVIRDGIHALPPWVESAERDRAEQHLCQDACRFSPREVRTLAERIRYLFDQDGALRDEEHQIDNRELHVGIGRDGMTVLHARLDREAGEKLREVLSPLARPRPALDGATDPRSAGRRHADALVTVLGLALGSDRLPRAGGARPQISITVGLAELRSALDGLPGAGGVLRTSGQPLTAAHIRRIACDADVLPVVMNGDGVPLDVGRTQRTAPPRMRAALLARDGPCAHPGCDQPPGTSEAHHLVSWIDGGPTSVQNMVMLCAHHHRTVHSHRWEITMHHGRPMFLPPPWIDPTRTPRPGGKARHQAEFILTRQPLPNMLGYRPHSEEAEDWQTTPTTRGGTRNHGPRQRRTPSARLSRFAVVGAFCSGRLSYRLNAASLAVWPGRCSDRAEAESVRASATASAAMSRSS